jgi:hypothetical protein
LVDVADAADDVGADVVAELLVEGLADVWLAVGVGVGVSELDALVLVGGGAGALVQLAISSEQPIRPATRTWTPARAGYLGHTQRRPS